MNSKISHTFLPCLGGVLFSLSLYGIPSLADSPERIASDVARLKALIKNHNELMNGNSHQSTSANGHLDSAQDNIVNADNIDWSKVVFSEQESIYVVERIEKTISEASVNYREVDKLLHIKGSRDGNLLYNRTQSLKSKGNGHYLGRLKLQSGSNNVSIEGKSWQFALEADIETEYIVVYSVVENKICILPLKGILNATASQLPGWLPLTDAERERETLDS